MKMESVLTNEKNKQLLFSSEWQTLELAMFYVLLSKILLLILSISSIAYLFLSKPDSFFWYLVPSILVIWSIKMLIGYREYLCSFCVYFQLFYFVLLFFSKSENEETFNKLTNSMTPHIRSIVTGIMKDFIREGLDDGIIK